VVSRGIWSLTGVVKKRDSSCMRIFAFVSVFMFVRAYVTVFGFSFEATFKRFEDIAEI
jgi:hypothetical protein